MRLNRCIGKQARNQSMRSRLVCVRCIADLAELHNQKQMLCLLLECLNALLLCYHLGGVQHGTRPMVCPSYMLETGGSIPSRPLILVQFSYNKNISTNHFYSCFTSFCCCCILDYLIPTRKETLKATSLAGYDLSYNHHWYQVSPSTFLGF